MLHLYFISLHTADGFIHFLTTCCEFNSSDLKDIKLIKSYYYNKVEFTRFSSSVGKHVGYTEVGVKIAEFWNNNTTLLAVMRAQKVRFCLNHARVWYKQRYSA
ncbi:H-2 class II histocompatibility antigen, I-E beta chain-like [Sebastes umbrosus]|uniref:H-2 class II histocompatibility antigen, I-E beta chain-like n=1 Tax=Sebastes umbrosus TaxID=72105 RepID=UPI00189F467E|nr:H-2 class II histocompatibility antigen, I-E beta chain-like [Sebastes umbrosus]